MNTVFNIISMNTFLHVLIACGITFMINLPFGYWRAGFRKLSFMWFLMIHLPVPFLVLIRRINHLHLSWALAPFLVGSFFLGQYYGRKIYGWKPYLRGNSNTHKKQIPNCKKQI